MNLKNKALTLGSIVGFALPSCVNSTSDRINVPLDRETVETRDRILKQIEEERLIKQQLVLFERLKKLAVLEERIKKRSALLKKLKEQLIFLPIDADPERLELEINRRKGEIDTVIKLVEEVKELLNKKGITQSGYEMILGSGTILPIEIQKEVIAVIQEKYPKCTFNFTEEETVLSITKQVIGVTKDPYFQIRLDFDSLVKKLVNNKKQEKNKELQKDLIDPNDLNHVPEIPPEEKSLVTTIPDFRLETIDGVIEKLKEHDPKKPFMLDLRNNGGGLTRNAQKLLEIFLEEGLIQNEVKAGKKEAIDGKGENEEVKTDFPILILTNEKTASASETVMSFLKQHLKEKVVFIGEETYGKFTSLSSESIPLSRDNSTRLNQNCKKQFKAHEQTYEFPTIKAIEVTNSCDRKAGGHQEWDGIDSDISVNWEKVPKEQEEALYALLSKLAQTKELPNVMKTGELKNKDAFSQKERELLQKRILKKEKKN